MFLELGPIGRAGLVTAVEQAADGIIITDLTAKIQYVNPAFTALTGYSSEEVVGQHTRLLKSGLETPACYEELWNTIRSGRVWSGALVNRRKDGSLYDEEMRISPVRDAQGEVVSYIAIKHDVTERKQAAIARQESETAFRTLTDAMPHMVWITTPDGLNVYFSQQWVDYTGLTVAESQGRGSKLPFHPDDRPIARNAWKHATEKGGPYTVESRLRAVDGSYRWFLIRGIPAHDAAGHISKWFGTCTDIDEKKRLEGQLRSQNLELERQNRKVEEANRMKSEFLANMSHELRSPLNGIIGFTELLYDGKLGAIAEKPREFLNRIHKSAKHLLQLINGVLDLSKIEAGRLDLRLERVRLPELVQEVAGVLGAMAAERRIRIAIELDSEVDRVTTDPGRFKQILYNYLSNALKFTPEGGNVTVRLKPEGQADFRLEVSDTGVGIHEQDIPRLFTEFQQLDSTAAKRYQGTGLGLAVTKRIVEAQGGRVGVRSRLGAGSTFYAVLPRRSGVFGGLATILVIEDEKIQRFVLTNMLQNSGYAVETAATCAEAVAKCRERRFDAITLDMMLPDGLGSQALASIRSMKENQDTPIIVITMLPQEETGASHHVQGFLTKPVYAKELITLLERCGVGKREGVA